MRILVAGDGRSAIHERAIAAALGMQGHAIDLFLWHRYFQPGVHSGIRPSLTNWGARIEERLLYGPRISRLNRDLVAACWNFRPDLTFVYRGSHIRPETIRQIGAAGSVVFGYNNDDPFGGHPRRYWRHFIASLPMYDHVFAYRPKNLEDYHSLSLRSVSLLRSYYIRELNFPLTELSARSYVNDVLFAGHYEPDARARMLRRLVHEGVDLRIVGPEWERAPERSDLGSALAGYTPRGPEYNVALNSAKIGLVFLSKLNNDSYTRRCFEIPAARTFMLAEYSSDLASLFREGKEAEFFRNEQELVDKVRYYLSNRDKRIAIATSGYERVLRDGHEVSDRARQVVETYAEFIAQRDGFATTVRVPSRRGVDLTDRLGLGTRLGHA